MGRVVELKNLKTGEIIPSVISVDRLTNELIALKTEYMKIPDEIKGVNLTPQQKEILQEGKPLYMEGMISKKESRLVLHCSSMLINGMLNLFLTGRLVMK